MKSTQRNHIEGWASENKYEQHNGTAGASKREESMQSHQPKDVMYEEKSVWLLILSSSAKAIESVSDVSEP